MISDRRKSGLLVAGLLLIVCLTGCANPEKGEVHLSDHIPNSVSEESSSESDKKLSTDIRIEASTAFSLMAENILENAFNPAEHVDYTIIPVSTSDGFSDISSGKTDFLIASPPNEQQLQLMEESDIEIESMPVTSAALVILVNKDNPVESLSLDQLRDLYLHDEENWSTYGGKDDRVTTYQLTEGNGSQTAFSQFIKGTRISESHREIATMNKIIDAVADDRGGICYAFAPYYFEMYYSNNTKVLKIDGKSYDDPEYPFLCEVSLYYNKIDTDQLKAAGLYGLSLFIIIITFIFIVKQET